MKWMLFATTKQRNSNKKMEKEIITYMQLSPHMLRKVHIAH